MAINKFVDRQGNTLLDLSNDSISPNKVLTGITYHGPDGLQYTGTLNPGPLDYSQYNFIDYDGTLLYSYTDEELDALEALPEGPDHTDDNLTFQSWNWLLSSLKNWDKTRPDRPIVGANYITTDGKSYLYMNTPYAGATLSFSKSGTLNSVDWGDGIVNTNTSHVYTNPGEYVIVIDMAPSGYWYFDSNQPTTSLNKQWIKRIKLGNVRRIQFSYAFSLQSVSIPNSIASISDYCFQSCYSLQSVSIPNGVTSTSNNTFYECCSLKNISISESVTNIGNYCFQNCYSIQNISIPNGVTNIGSSAFRNCYSLQNVSIPNSVTSINTQTFQNCYSLQNISIPDGITSINSSAFGSCYTLTIDLTKQTKVVNLPASINLNTIYNKILVPDTLLTDYKSASYWSSYANIMVGI